MNIKLEEIKTLPPSKLCILLSNIIKDTYTKYHYAKIPKEVYEEIVISSIKNFQDNLSADEQYAENYFTDELEAQIAKYLNKTIHNSNQSQIELIHSYIEEKIDIPKDYAVAIQNLHSLNAFLTFINYPGDYTEIVKNSKIEETLNLIVKEISSLDTFENHHEKKIMTIYCYMHNISLDDNIDAESAHLLSTSAVEGGFSSDALKDYLSYIKSLPKKILTKDEIKKLYVEIGKGNERAREIIVESNLFLVISIAKNYFGCGLEKMEIIQEGNYGLLVAIEKFNPDLGFAFSTYASWWIRQAITRAIADTSRPIRLPLHLHNEIYQYKKVANFLSEEFHREPTLEEIASKMQVPSSKVTQAAQAQVTTVSLNYKVYDKSDNEKELQEIIPSDEDGPEEIVLSKDLVHLVQHVVATSKLTEKELYVLSHRFELDGKNKMSLEEIAEKLNVTRERVRQIESTAISKIRGRNQTRTSLISYADNEDQASKNLEYYRNKSVFSHRNGVYSLSSPHKNLKK